MITINTNTTAMVAQNNLNTTQSNMSSSMLKLSTGLRINSASDDAAGMQISNRMETQINGLGIAQRNANDGISMAQTAEGAVTETTDMLNRMRDLALQSANDSNTAEDRDAMQKEVDSLTKEIDRVAETTEFAGIKLLNGDSTGDAGTTANFKFQVGAQENQIIDFNITNMDASSLGIKNTAGSAEFSYSADTLTIGIAAKDVKLVDDQGAETTINVDPTDIGAAQVVLDTAFGPGATIDAAGNIDISKATGTTNYVSARVDAATAVSIQSTEMTKGIDIKADPQTAIDTIDKALAKVDAQRADLGAVQNRLESTIDNLGNIETNMSASQSRIKDVDFAKETTNMTSQQMMMQAGSTILSQAKSLPQYATQLLG